MRKGATEYVDIVLTYEPDTESRGRAYRREMAVKKERKHQKARAKRPTWAEFER